MHIEYIPQMLIVWVNEFIYWKVSLTAHKRYFYIDFFVFNLWCLQQLTKGLLASECTCLLHCCQGDLLKRKSEHTGLLQVARGREAGCWNPQVATSQPCQNKVPVFSDFCQLCSLSLYTCVFPGQLEIHEFLQSASPLVAFCLHTCSPFCLACPFWTCSSFEKGSSTISCRKPLHPLFQLSLGFLLFATDTFTMLYCNFWSPCLPFLLDLGHIESRNPGPSFLPILPHGLPVNTGWVGGWMDGDV